MVQTIEHSPIGVPDPHFVWVPRVGRATTPINIALILFSLSFLIVPGTSFPDDESEFEKLRNRMVEEQILSRGITDEKILKVIRNVPRHKFVPHNMIDLSYRDHPVPIGCGQTISQPYIVALMTQCLKLTGNEKVLEIGTGSGYQIAIIARLVKGKVYTIEIIEELGKSAEKRLKELGYKNIEVKIADGYFGWEEKAPFDRIIVTCAPDHAPSPLAQQLKEGGIMVIPVGPPGSYQTLWQIEKRKGKLVFNNMGGCIFVPLLRSRKE